MGFSSENEKILTAREILPPCTGENMERVEKAEKSLTHYVMSKYFGSSLDEEKVGEKLIANYAWFLFI